MLETDFILRGSKYSPSIYMMELSVYWRSIRGWVLHKYALQGCCINMLLMKRGYRYIPSLYMMELLGLLEDYQREAAAQKMPTAQTCCSWELHIYPTNACCIIMLLMMFSFSLFSAHVYLWPLFPCLYNWIFPGFVSGYCFLLCLYNSILIKFYLLSQKKECNQPYLNVRPKLQIVPFSFTRNSIQCLNFKFYSIFTPVNAY